MRYNNNCTTVAIDGPDLAGKSTLIESIKEAIEKHNLKVKVVHFPRYDKPIGKLIESILNNKKIKIDPYSFQSLYFADINDFCNTELKKLKKEYDFIIYDRFYYSTIVYSKVLGLSIEQLAFLSKDIIKPDLFINITSDIAITIERLLSRNLPPDRFESQNEFVSKTIDQYKNVNTIIFDIIKFCDEHSLKREPFNEKSIKIHAKKSHKEILEEALNFIVDLDDLKLREEKNVI
ncbi:MAG: hypothetical protein B6I28_06115 [Fusobacteriia bacterium 4572_132]|nr:MAG: hypothetical protein B6I28_06115 [Fusobacteriia bacterium 4572_132]